MACTLLSPLNLPTSSSSSSSINHCAIKTKTTTTTITATATAAAANSRCWRRTSRRTATTVIAKASEKDGGEGDDSPAFNPFGFVTNNPSSKSAIQLPESPAEDGNVGQMLYVRPFPTPTCSFSSKFSKRSDVDVKHSNKKN